MQLSFRECFIRRKAVNLQDGDLHYLCKIKIKKNSCKHLAKVLLTAPEANSISEEFHCSRLVDIVESTRNCTIICRYLGCWTTTNG